MKTNIVVRSDQKTKGLRFSVSAFLWVFPVFFGCNLSWIASDFRWIA